MSQTMKTLNGYEIVDNYARTQITAEKAALKQEIATERKRIDALASLPEGSTAGDAELVDAHIDYTGKNWESTGAHIRGVTSELSQQIDAISDKGISKNVLNKNDASALIGKLADSNSNTIYDNEGYNVTPYIPIEKGEHVTLSAHKGIPDQSAVYYRMVTIYDKDKNIIKVPNTSGVNSYIKDYIVSDDNAKFMRASLSTVVWNSDDVMLEKTTDGLETEYEEYFEPYNVVKIEALPIENTVSETNEKIPTSKAVQDYAYNRFYGKKITAFGDSITHGATWFPALEIAFNTTITKLGNSGCRLIDVVKDQYIEQIPTDTELLLIMLGMNDWTNNTPLGEKLITNTDNTTFRGACNVIISKIQSRVPNAKIICLGTTFGYYPNRNTFTDKRGLYNNLGMTSIDYGREMVDMFKLNGIESYCIGEYCGWNENNIANYCISDGAFIHPNNSVGGVALGNAIVRLIK